MELQLLSENNLKDDDVVNKCMICSHLEHESISFSYCLSDRVARGPQINTELVNVSACTIELWMHEVVLPSTKVAYPSD